MPFSFEFTRCKGCLGVQHMGCGVSQAVKPGDFVETQMAAPTSPSRFQASLRVEIPDRQEEPESVFVTTSETASRASPPQIWQRPNVFDVRRNSVSMSASAATSASGTPRGPKPSSDPTSPTHNKPAGDLFRRPSMAGLLRSESSTGRRQSVIVQSMASGAGALRTSAPPRRSSQQPIEPALDGVQMF